MTQLSQYESKAKSTLRDIASTKVLPTLENQSREQYEQICFTQLGEKPTTLKINLSDQRHIIHGWNVNSKAREESWASHIKSRAAELYSIKLKEKLERLKKKQKSHVNKPQSSSENLKVSKSQGSEAAFPSTSKVLEEEEGDNSNGGKAVGVGKELPSSSSNNSEKGDGPTSVDEVDAEDDQMSPEEEEEEDENIAEEEEEDDHEDDDDTEEAEEGNDSKAGKTLTHGAKSKLNAKASTFTPAKKTKMNSDQTQAAQPRVARSQAGGNKRKPKGSGPPGTGRRKVARTGAGNGGRGNTRRGRGRKRGGAGIASK